MEEGREGETKEENNGVKGPSTFPPVKWNNFLRTFKLCHIHHAASLAFCHRRAHCGEAAAISGTLTLPILSFNTGLMSCSVKYPESIVAPGSESRNLALHSKGH